jgi:glycosyltransferase involved in cell wall biosynthesis
MASGTPILMIGPGGDAAELVRVSGTGSFVPAHDGDAVAEMLRLLATQPHEFRARYYHPRPEVIARYERRALTQRLAAVFDQLVVRDTSR